MSDPVAPQSRSGHGCLWGCLIVLAVIAVPVLGAIGYGAWYFYDGYRHDPGLQAAMTRLRHDGLARRVLGNDIEITGIEGNAIATILGRGSQGAYLLDLHGSKGAGRLGLVIDMRAKRPVVKSMMLIGPDGRSYDLLARGPPRPVDSI